MRQRLALRNKTKSEKHLEMGEGKKGRNRNESVFARPNGPCENAETAISCRVPGRARKKKEVHK